MNRLFCITFFLWGCGLSPSWAQETLPLVDLSKDDWTASVKATSSQVTLSKSTVSTDPGINVVIEPGENQYPGFRIKNIGDSAFDLSKFGHIEAKITNTGVQPISVTLRVDGTGDARNAAVLSLKAGESKVMRLIFGYYDKKKVQDLDTAKIQQLLFFTGKAKEKGSFCIESLVAGGQPGETPSVDPQNVRIKPKDGWLLGGDAVIDDAKQLQTVGEAKAEITAEGKSARMLLPANKANAALFVQPSQGRWDLRDFVQVSVKLRNEGNRPVTPRVMLKSNGGDSEWVAASQPLLPGTETELVVPFARHPTWKYGDDKNLFKFSSNTVRGLMVTTLETDAGAERVLTVTAARGELPIAVLPDWLGKRPPVEGDWTLTLEDNFDGDLINENNWSSLGSNFWDKRSHFSKANTFVKAGKLHLRFEKKRGFHNDDPATNKETDYTTGFLQSYGKWTQLYGYFEARLKPPRANGLWPAFWLMPDRGMKFAPEQWKRQDIAKDGMEFDIYEPLTGWGPNRYGLALHWDGYGKNHKAAGSTVYAAPDKEGFLTVGLLWTPGVAVFYCNGKEYGRMENERISNIPSEIIFTLPSGGWDNTPLDDKELTGEDADFVVDYVRVWQRKDLASAEDGYKNPDGSSRR